ncbi:MAG: Thiamine biosynthesis lipoprotein ApbE precursor [Planctomycetota bacterium]|jgi:thiamine biosynthesis lipoprotein
MCHGSRALLLVPLTAVITSLLLHPAIGQEPLRIAGKTMGSYYSIVIDSAAPPAAAPLQQQIEAVFADLNRQMSTWDPNSEISRFNQAVESTEWFPVSRDFAVVTSEARRLHTLTSGALEITLAPLIEAWGFGRSRKKRIPADAEIVAALKLLGTQFIEVRSDPPAIRRTRPGIQISLNALAPGYAADRISELLREQSLKAHVVDVGGENRAGAAKRSGEPWRLGVESPLGNLHKILELTEKSIATSGDYRNFFVIENQRYSHVLDPRTGRPVADPPASVSVTHASCMTADGLATAMMVLGAEKGLRLAKQAGFDVMFLNVDSNGTLVEQSSGQFAATPPETDAR